MVKRTISNIVLIGMPGAGKSTIGVILAKQTARDFLDTDVLIQFHEQRSLQDILDKEGYLALRRIEERILLTLDRSNHVIATGGSAAYSVPAMNHLKMNGIIVFLHVELDEIKRRVTDYETRGIARRPDQSFEDLYAERKVLYYKYADIIIDCAGMNHEQIVAAICREL
jgi:shikimate kinase